MILSGTAVQAKGLGYGLTGAAGILEPPILALEEWLWG
jgi:hypothetical protein